MLASVRFLPVWERTALKFQRVGFFRFVDGVCAEGGNASLYHGFVFLWRTLCAVIRRKLRKIGAHNLRREVTVLSEDQQSGSLVVEETNVQVPTSCSLIDFC